MVGWTSTAVAGAAALTCRDRLYSYSAVFPEIPEADDSALIQIAARHHRIRNKTFEPMKLDIAEYFDGSLRAHGDFLSAGNIHIVMRMLELAERDGCQTILNGVDGDNIASPGLYRLTELANAGRWREFGRCATAVADIYAGIDNFSARDMFTAWGQPLLRDKAAKGALLEVFWAPLALTMTRCVPFPQSVRLLLSSLLRRSVNRQQWRGIFSRDELNGATLDDIKYSEQIKEDMAHKTLSERSAQIKTLSKASEHYFEYIHSISAKRGIATLFPFMDRELIEFCLAVPAEHKLRHGWTRAFLRHGMGDIYPPQIAWQRRKSNLFGGLDATIRSEYLPAIEAALTTTSDPVWQFFDLEGMRELIDKAKGGNRGAHNKICLVWAVSRCLSLNVDDSSSPVDAMPSEFSSS